MKRITLTTVVLCFAAVTILLGQNLFRTPHHLLQLVAGVARAASPTFDPTSGVVPITVTVASTTPSVTVYWSTNNWVNTNTGATVDLTYSTAIAAYVSASGYSDSLIVTSEVYTAAFSPSDVAGLIMWYDANTITNYFGGSSTNGMPVTNWFPRTEVTNYFALSNSGSVNTKWTNNESRLNSKPWIEFYADRYKHGGTSNGVRWEQPLTYYVVARWSIITNSIHFLFDGTNTCCNNKFFARNDSAHRISIDSGAEIYTSQDTISSNVWYLFEVTYNASSSSLYMNGISVTNWVQSPGTEGLSGLYLGASSTDGSYFEGGIAEVLIYQSALSSSADRVDIRGYFTNKYGIYANW